MRVQIPPRASSWTEAIETISEYERCKKESPLISLIVIVNPILLLPKISGMKEEEFKQEFGNTFLSAFREALEERGN